MSITSPKLQTLALPKSCKLEDQGFHDHRDSRNLWLLSSSFGVVLMELITGKKPVEAEFGENKNIIYWVSTKVETKEGAADVLDKRVVGSYEEDMITFALYVARAGLQCSARP
ncbi:UNVERIFIED_CONTAM: Receptor protein-tyrosine kinase CEPR1 [Sesamum angustifolium]|uniref:Receptor protein-tyrosine kinase CEPR1 n=1 Tax=Sesamum angustifolium TaxID=2727405 RepID=A0AAW2LWV5_9LAMI